MWNSNGDIISQTVEVVDSGDMHVTGRIDGNSNLRLRSTGGSITVDGRIDGSSVVYLVTSGGSVKLQDRVDGSATVVLVSTVGTVTIAGEINGSSGVTIEAEGDIAIGTQGGDDDKMITGSSSVALRSNSGSVTVGGTIDGSNVVDITAPGGAIALNGRIDGSSIVHALADSDISIGDRIDGSSRVELVSNRGSVTIDGRIDGDSSVRLNAGGDIGVGVGQQGGDGDHKIDGECYVTAIAGGQIRLGSFIAGSNTRWVTAVSSVIDRTTVDFAAGGPVTIGGAIGSGALVRLLSAAASITVAGGVTDQGTRLTTWPPGAAHPQVSNGAQWSEGEWAVAEALTATPKRDGYWWTNWPQSFGYVAPFRQVPRTLKELVKAVKGAATSDQPDRTPVKAVGGGWSFTDASLPFKSAAEVNNASLVKKGAWQRQDLRNVLLGFDDTFPTPMDLWPEAVARSATTFNTYDQFNHRRVTRSGGYLPASSEVRLIDTRSFASSLQCEFEDIRAASDKRRDREILFHVEAGITMADLQQLLDHQHPPLAIRATGGSPGATLAGALSTATHGGEFKTHLLVDLVRAVHLVGPGGEQWWIEGDLPVAVYAKLHKHYPKIDLDHFIAAGWNAIPGLSSQDVLNSVVVSMGTMGVIYSMVIAVVPQFGIRQVVHPTTWSELLSAALTTEAALRSGDSAANQAVLHALKDGKINGTGIKEARNEYIDLAINPLNRDCWIVNREVTKSLPEDSNNAPAGVGNYVTALSRALQQHSRSALQGSMFAGRVFDFFYWGSDLVNFVGHIGALTGLISFVTDSGDSLGGLLATGSAQAVLNIVNQAGSPDRGQQFLADLLSGFFHALEGTEPGQNSDITGVSNKVGAIGWPASGLPGRGLEIALSHENAFTFLQQVLFDDVLANDVIGANRPLIGYISIRVCPKTNTLMGMQQYGPHSVMIEVVAYQSPEANHVMDSIQKKAITWQGPGPKPLLHWGLENNMVDHAYLLGTPLGEPYKAGMSRLEVFRKIRNFLRHGNVPVFDNAFSARIGV
jgi:hypothetical protein